MIKVMRFAVKFPKAAGGTFDYIFHINEQKKRGCTLVAESTILIQPLNLLN